ncbi:MAG: hypothetical protein LBR27_04150 [Bifidobacteriaceae bacterium]|jgi:hypothetical protein|nr:hypothetical protein [Bifidobacteriaceae bacterium]
MEGQSVSDTGTAQHSRGDSRKQIIYLAVGGVIALLLVGGLIALFYFTGQKDTPAAEASPLPTPPTPTITVTITEPAPSATVSPMARAEGTAFYLAMPATVNAYSLVEATPNLDWESAGAIEAYTLTYSDGTDAVTVQAGQWRTDQLATDALTGLGGAAASDKSVTWANQTALFKVEAPKGGAPIFEAGFPF